MIRARDLMHPPVAVPAHAYVIEAVGLLRSGDYSQLPVVEGDRLVGVFTKARLLDILLYQGNLQQMRVADVLVQEFTTVTPDTPLNVLLGYLADGPGHPFLLVREGERLVGVVTPRDLLVLAEPWLLIQEVEFLLRRTIDRRLASVDRRWARRLLPDGFRRRWEQERDDPRNQEARPPDHWPEGLQLLQYATFWDYRWLVEKHWDQAFSTLFLHREETLGHLAVLHRTRNLMAHVRRVEPELRLAAEAAARALLRYLRQDEDQEEQGV